MAARSGRLVGAPVESLHCSMSSTLLRNSAADTTMKSLVHAAIIALRDSAPLSRESWKSTTTLRPASPPCALTYLVNPLKPSTTPWNRPGASGVSTSATTATLIWVGDTPISGGGGATPAVAVAAAATTSVNVVSSTTKWTFLIGSPRSAATRSLLPGVLAPTAQQ